MTGQMMTFGFLVKSNADGDEVVWRITRTYGGSTAMMGIKVEKIEECL